MTNKTTGAWTPELREEVCGMKLSHSAGRVSDMLAARGYVFSRNAIIGIWHRAGLTKPTPQRPRVPKHERVGVPVGCIAYQVISGIKRRQRAVARPTPEPFVCQEPPAVEPLRLSMADINSGQCRWPYGAQPDEPGEGSYRFCGHPVCSRMVLGKAHETSWCAAHAEIAFGKGTVSEQRALSLPSGVAA